MAELLTTPQSALLDGLFAPSERWGWEYREPDTLPQVFPHPRPVPFLPWPNWSAELAPKLEQAEARRPALCVAAAVTLLVALTIGLRAPSWTLLFLGATAVLGYLGLARPWLLRRRAAAEQRRWMEACVAAHRRYQQEHQAWAMAKWEHQQRQLARLAATPEWAALRPRRPLDRLDVYGGGSYGWEALITGAGASLLASGVQLTIVDLTRDAVAAELTQLAEVRGHATDVLVLPEHAEDLDLFGDLAPETVRDVLVEALHGDERDASHEARSMDARIIGALCESLDPPLSLARLCAGLRVLLRQESPPGPDGELTVEEYRRVGALFGETVRRSAEPRMVALESRLHHLRLLGRRAGWRSLGGPGAQLRVVAIGEGGSELVEDVLAHLLLQLLVHTTRRDPEFGGRPATGAAGRVVMVVGADPLRRRHLERLDQLSRQRGLRLVFMFRHLRDEAVELLGGGGAAMFMRLGNAREAASAAEFIGREHRFVLHQLTRSTGESVTHTLTESVTDTIGSNTGQTRTDLLRVLLPLPVSNSYTAGKTSSRAWGSSRSRATGTSTSESPGQQRVHEFAVEPHVLQQLPETAFLFVDHAGGGRGPRATLGDCNPDIVTLPNVSAEPFPR